MDMRDWTFHRVGGDIRPHARVLGGRGDRREHLDERHHGPYSPSRATGTRTCSGIESANVEYMLRTNNDNFPKGIGRPSRRCSGTSSAVASSTSTA